MGEAAKCLELLENPNTAEELLYRAFAQDRLGQTAQARQTFIQAARRADPPLRGHMCWTHRVRLEQLLREARQKLGAFEETTSESLPSEETSAAKE